MIDEIYSKMLDKIYAEKLPLPKNCRKYTDENLALIYLYYNSILGKNNFAYLGNDDKIRILEID